MLSISTVNLNITQKEKKVINYFIFLKCFLNLGPIIGKSSI